MLVDSLLFGLDEGMDVIVYPVGQFNTDPDSGSAAQQAGAFVDLIAERSQIPYNAKDVPFETVSRRRIAQGLNEMTAKALTDQSVVPVLDRGLGMAEEATTANRKVGQAFVDRTGKVGKAARDTGLVVSRPDVLTRRNFLRGQGESVGRGVKHRGTIGTISTGIRNLRVGKAVKDAAKRGEFGEEALRGIADRFPDSVAKQVSVPRKGLAAGELKPRKLPLTKVGKAATTFVKAAPLIGTAFDLANVKEEFSDPDSTKLEKAASLADLALGATGAPLVLDLVAGATNHDGFFAMLVGDKD